MVSKHFKVILSVFIVMVVVVSVVIYLGVIKQHFGFFPAQAIKIDGMYLNQPTEISEFHLVDQHGQPFTKNNLKGHWTFVFFGFTNCPYVCPTTMAALNKMYVSLQAELPVNQLPQVAMVTVDPARDTTERMNSFVSAFNPNFVGLRAEMPEITRLENEFHIAAVKMDVQGQSKDHYTINHTAEILVVNPEGQLQAFLAYPHDAEQMKKDYKAILAARLT